MPSARRERIKICYARMKRRLATLAGTVIIVTAAAAAAAAAACMMSK